MVSTMSPRSIPISTNVLNIPQMFSIITPRFGYGVYFSLSITT